MTAAPTIKGWCPTLLSPMQSGDGWLARVKPTAATVSAAQRAVIAEAARRHGNGHIDLTSRANFQIRGLTPSLGRAVRGDHHRRGARQRAALLRGDPQRHGEPARTRRSIGIVRRPCGRARPRSHARRGAGASRRCPPNSASSSMAAGCCRSPASPPTSWSGARRRARGPARRRHACRTLRAIGSRSETVEALALAFLQLSGHVASRRAHARAGHDRGEEAIFAPPVLTSACACAPATPKPRRRSASSPIQLERQAHSASGCPSVVSRRKPSSELADLSERFGDGTLKNHALARAAPSRHCRSNAEHPCA